MREMEVRATLERVRGLAVELTRHVRDRGLSINAAAVAYNVFLAVVPLGFALLGTAGLVGRSATAVEQVGNALDPLVPSTVKDFILELLRDAGDRLGGGSVWVIFGSILLALLFGSRAVAALQKSLAFTSTSTERRPGFQLRLVAVALTIGGGVALVVTSFTLVVGGRFVGFLSELTGIGALDEVWSWLRIPVAAAGLYLFVLALYHWGPPEPLHRAWLAALVATGGAVLGSLVFGIYLDLSPELGAPFGVLGAVAIALVWLYVGALAILAGAVLVADLVPDQPVRP
jgi:membrane protein